MEMQLAEQLGVSRTPIREAIRKLELEGLVLMIPRRGAIVAKITEKDFNEFYEFHQLDSGDCRIVIKNISGYVMVKDGYFDILLDGSPDYFDIE